MRLSARSRPNEYSCDTAGSQNARSCRDRRGILLGRRVTSGCDRKVAYVANIVSAVTIDCVDPQWVARFGCDLLGRKPGRRRTAWATWAIAAIPIRTWYSGGCRGQLDGIQDLCPCLYSGTFGEFLRDAVQASGPQSALYGSSRGPRVSYCASRHYGG